MTIHLHPGDWPISSDTEALSKGDLRWDAAPEAAGGGRLCFCGFYSLSSGLLRAAGSRGEETGRGSHRTASSPMLQTTRPSAEAAARQAVLGHRKCMPPFYRKGNRGPDGVISLTHSPSY